MTRRLLPLLDWLPAYPSAWLRPDVLAGLTTAAVVIPKAMAYATVAGLPVEVGLYTAFVPAVVYALLGSSRPLSVSTTTTLAILSGATLALVVPNSDPAALLAAAATLAVLVGAILVAASLLRLGFVASFISEPVLVGFKAGIGLVIVLDQVPKLLGLHIGGGSFVQKLLALVAHLPQTSAATLAVGAAMIAILAALEHWAPRAPAPLVAVAVGIAAGRAFAGRGEPRPDANQELLATGVANAVGGLFGAMPAGGGTSQTAVNRQAGARTQLAALVTAAATIATLLLLAPWMALMPQATLAAVVIVYSLGLIQLADFRAILRTRGMEFRWAVIACAGVVLLGTLKGIVVAIVVSLVAISYQAARPRVSVLGRKRGSDVFRPLSEEHPDDETFPGLLMVRPEGRIFFANAQHIGEQLLPLIDAAQPRVVAFDLSAVPDIEYSALKMLTEGEERLRERGVALWLVALNSEVLGMIQRSPLGETLGRERMIFTLPAAVERFLAQPAAAARA